MPDERSRYEYHPQILEAFSTGKSAARGADDEGLRKRLAALTEAVKAEVRTEVGALRTEHDALAARVAELEAEITRRERLTIDQAMVEMVDERCRLADGVVGDVSLALDTMRAAAAAAEARVGELEEALGRALKYESERWHTRGCTRTGSGCWVEDDFALLAATGKAGDEK